MMLISDFSAVDCFHRNCQLGKGANLVSQGSADPKRGKSKNPPNPKQPLGINTAPLFTALDLFLELSDGNFQRSKGNTSECIFRSVKKHFNYLNGVTELSS